jgi:hypothetical protein
MTVFCVHLVINQLSPRPVQEVWSVRAGGMDCPSRTKSHPAGSLFFSQPGGPPCWAGPQAFSLIASHPPPPLKEAACGHRSSDDRKRLITPTSPRAFSYRWSAFRSPRSTRPRRSPWLHTGKRDSPRPSGRPRRPCPPGNGVFYKSKTSYS